MDSTQFDRLTRRLGDITHRRSLLRSAAGLGGGIAALALVAGSGAVKNSGKGKDKDKDKGKGKTLCRSNGSTCKKKGANCSAGNCLSAPFTIEATWSTDDDYNTYLFLPQDRSDPVPSPHVTSWRCNTKDGGCQSGDYPYVCIDQDGNGPGPEVTTVYKLLKGNYEFYMYLVDHTDAGALKVALRDKNGRVLRNWSSPANPNGYFINWHVFDIDGATGTVKSFDKTSDNGLPTGAHYPTEPVCTTPMEI